MALIKVSYSSLSIQQKFRFEIWEIPRAQWNSTFQLHRPDRSHHAFGYCSCKIQKSGTGDNNFVKWLTDHFGPTDQDNGTVKVDHLQIKAGPKCSGWTKPKWCVPFDVTTEISVVLGWMESAHDELDPCQCQQAVNSLLFSLWWCTMQPAIVVTYLGRQNLLYSWFCYYFYPLRKIERCRSSPLWFAQTPWWLHEKTNSHTQTKRPAMLMSKTC